MRREEVKARHGRLRKGYGYHPPVAGPWCDVIAGTGYIKSANDEGGGRNLFMEVVTYKTVQGRQLRMTPATATFFPVSGCSCAQDHQAPKGSTCEPTTFKLQEYHETTCVSDQQT